MSRHGNVPGDLAAPLDTRSRVARAALAACLLLATPSHAQDSSRSDRLRMFGPSQEVNARLDSLEQVASDAAKGVARRSALNLLAQHGKVWAFQHEPDPVIVYPGVVAQLRRLYPLATSQMRSAIVADLYLQAERGEAVSFLGELVLSREMGFEGSGIAEQAIEVLSMMGPLGEAALQRVHRSGLASEETMKTLDRLARDGYRRRPPRQDT